MSHFALKNSVLVELSEEEALEFQSSQISKEESENRSRIQMINRLVEKKILEIAPIWKQQNLLSHRMSVLTKKMEGQATTEQEKNLFDEAVSVAQKIEAIRSAGNSAVASGLKVDQIPWPSFSN